MLNLLLHKEAPLKFLGELDLKNTMQKLKDIYGYKNVAEDRQFYISEMMSTYGYCPHPLYEVLENFSPAEIIYALEQKLISQGVYDGVDFTRIKNTSVLARNNEKNSNWFKREGHNIKLISLSALGNGKKSNSCGKFINWIAELITLPSGNKNLGIYGTTIYLIPFHPRDFGCAYLPSSSDVSDKICDEKLADLGLDVKHQVKLFIALAGLSGHPVIYDILPQTSRFSKIILSHPSVCRWFDTKKLIAQITSFTEEIAKNMISKRGRKLYKKEEIESAKKVYIEVLNGSKKKYTKIQADIVEKFEEELKEFKIFSSYKMSFKDSQEELAREAKEIIETANGAKVSEENDITDQNAITSALIKRGLWPAPGGAWCSAGVPVFEKMNSTKEYPIFFHYNHNCEDVTKFANLDCQTPYYFTYFENKKFNTETIDFFIDYMKKLQEEYNFDGFRVDHIDHVVDELSQDKDGNPISYRAPQYVLNKLNTKMKRKIPYFATLAEYMLWDNYYKEYHKGMNFDLLWGNDIVSQSSKTPKQIIEDNEYLANYNQGCERNPLSILKTYNNQDGEFREINQYPGQLGANGALFKWFKYKFLPGGNLANRPTLFVDGDESYTTKGIEYVIGEETSMKRGENWEFFERFDAIDRFAKNSELIINGKASLIEECKDGFSAWKISAPNVNYEFLIVTNYFYPTEYKEIEINGETKKDMIKGTPCLNHTISLGDKKIVSYFDFQYSDFNKTLLKEIPIEEIHNEINFKIIQPAEFKIYKTTK